MGTKSNIAIAATVVVLGLGAAAYLDRPSSPQEQVDQQREQQMSDLQDSHDREVSRYEDEADDLRKAEESRTRIPGEHRPDLPKLPLPR